ncbi:MAG: tetratricopeptide repeat protein [Hyphomonadaceae bacterium]|nr:tetratricopeptide repeat protein [Hyphomonadaceae bacterium]
MTNETDSFVNEVDESLRQDRMLDYAKKYGPWLIGVFAVFILAVGGWQFWKEQTLNSARRHADEYAAAQTLLQTGDLAAAKTEFERLSNEGPRAYRTMAQMERAAILAQEGDLEGALAGFDAAAESAPDQIMRESAQIRAAYIAADTQDFAALQTRLQPLIDSDSRVQYLAKELLAVEAWEAGETELARTTLEQLQLAFEAPDSLRQRAQIALSVLGPTPAAATPETPAGGATTAPAPSEGETK